MLKKTFRLTKKDNISKIIRDGNKIPGKLFLCKVLKNELPNNRYTVIISRKVEKKATKRNKCRRRIYESIRNNKKNIVPEKTHFDIVILINKNCIKAQFSEIKREIIKIKL